jgi:hypothetical protein
MVLYTALCIHSQGQETTYYDDIKPILDRQCVSCHRPGEAGPMPLTTYEEVSAYGSMIQYVTTTKLMPPWYADPSYAHFSNERVLPETDIQKISDWVSSGMVSGNEQDVLAINLKNNDDKNDRKPDLVISMAEAFEQYGIYLDQYQVFIIPTHLAEDTWIEGIEFVPGNKKIVRFASISVETSDKFDTLDRWDPRYGYFSFGGLGKTPEQPFWYTWSPLQKPTMMPAGTARFLPKGSKLILHIHYGPTGRPQKDSSAVRLYFAAKAPVQQTITAPLINPYVLTGDSLFIPPEVKKVFHASYTLPYDVEVSSLTPQANLLCRSWEVYAKIPGSTVPLKLLKIKEWNVNWKQTYHLEEPVVLPKGTVIHALAHYDNTLDNPCNPSEKPVPFSWGAHLFSEMFFVHFGFNAIAAPARDVRISMAPVVSDSTLEVLLKLDKTYIAEILISDASDEALVTLDACRLHKGNHEITVTIESIPFGNYTLVVKDKSGKVLAEQLFVKMREYGL